MRLTGTKKKKKKDTASFVVAPEWYFAWKRGVRKENICCWNGGVALRAFSSTRLLSGASVPETPREKKKKKKKTHCAMQRREHALFKGPLQQNLFRSVYFMYSGLVERAWPRSFYVSVSLAAKKKRKKKVRLAVAVVFSWYTVPSTKRTFVVAAFFLVERSLKSCLLLFLFRVWFPLCPAQCIS